MENLTLPPLRAYHCQPGVPELGSTGDPEEVSRRTLAHEFAHLLGFDDAYLRGFDGDPDDPFGVGRSPQVADQSGSRCSELVYD